MTRLADLAALAGLYAARGGTTYGEDVTQIDHACQCAALAAAGGGPPALVAAALLHDIGHLLAGDASGDAGHAASGAAALATLFGDDVCGPVALHVAAKRWLCFAEPDYAARLSPASVASLGVQGGAFDAAAAAAFRQRPHAAAAVALRRFDDSGKQDRVSVPPFAAYLPLLADLSAAARGR